jgi:hypothetical protein
MAWGAEYANFTNTSQDAASLYYTEYRGNNVAYARTVQTRDAACALCSTPASAVIMIPGALLSCPSGYRLEYSGWLMANLFSNFHPSQSICVDLFPDSFNTSNISTVDGNILWFTESETPLLNANAEGYA